ncbi:MAG: ribose 5-phosphate isomerase B [Clostridia bacterium]|nr:ribose 5-phosphate isomerase B [Clostridia bacterium]
MVIIGSDHTGVNLKKQIIECLKINHITYKDVTDYNTQDGDDYPDIANIICRNVLKDVNNLGIAICGTGIGISIACNKIHGIRAAVCTDEYMAQMSRADNNANVLCLGSRTELAKDKEKIENIVNAFLEGFFEGGRHERRLDKIRQIEIQGGKSYDS